MNAPEYGLAQAVEESITHYAQTLYALQQFEEDAASFAPEEIYGFAEELRTRQEQAARIDAEIERRLRQGETASGLAEELAQRLELMHDVQAFNGLLSQKIRGMMSVISSELSQTRGGREAMSGYRSRTDGRGSIVSGNF